MPADRRSGKQSRSVFDKQNDTTLESVADAIFNDKAMIDKADRNRVFTRAFALHEIEVDQRIQVRLSGIDEETVEKYVQILLNGGHFDKPIIVYRDEETGKRYLADGFHRYEATRRALECREANQEIAPLIGEDRPGGYEGAFEYAEEANLKHGRPLAKKDKHGIFLRRIQRGHHWEQLSNRLIAAELGVDEGTIRKWREPFTAENSAVSEGEKEAESKKRIGKDGREIEIKGIQKEGKRRQRKKAEEKAQVMQHLSVAELLGLITNHIIAALRQGDLTWDELLRAAKRGSGQDIAPSLFNSVLRDMVRAGLIAPRACYAL
ncbi:MAG: hypothetical protein HY866_10100 [Chloroflexi bacterium]|nr:hypothetical protein [Chloroflexota bacterium]